MKKKKVVGNEKQQRIQEQEDKLKEAEFNLHRTLSALWLQAGAEMKHPGPIVYSVQMRINEIMEILKGIEQNLYQEETTE